MNEREKNIHLWFEMWLTKQDLGIDNIFAEDVIYTESWGPKYNNRQIVKHWFQEWNTRGKVEMSRNVQSGNTQNLKSSAAPARLPAAPATTPGTSQAAAQAGCVYRP